MCVNVDSKGFLQVGAEGVGGGGDDSKRNRGGSGSDARGGGDGDGGGDGGSGGGGGEPYSKLCATDSSDAVCWMCRGWTQQLFRWRPRPIDIQMCPNIHFNKGGLGGGRGGEGGGGGGSKATGGNGRGSGHGFSVCLHLCFDGYRADKMVSPMVGTRDTEYVI